MAIAALMPASNSFFSDADRHAFDLELEKYGLCKSPKDYILNAWDLSCSRSHVRQVMEKQYKDADKKDWDWHSVPWNSNHQAYWATHAYLRITKAKGFHDDAMLGKLVDNLRLLTNCYQEIRAKDCKPMFMEWWNKDY